MISVYVIRVETQFEINKLATYDDLSKKKTLKKQLRVSLSDLKQNKTALSQPEEISQLAPSSSDSSSRQHEKKLQYKSVVSHASKRNVSKRGLCEPVLAAEICVSLQGAQ